MGARANPERQTGAGRRAAGARSVAVLGLVLAASVLAWSTWQPAAEAPAPQAASAAPPVSANPPATAPAAFAALVGEWQRSDGGYVLAVSGVTPDGQATASYFNPRPIHVARAEARREGDRIGLFVELRDVNYPGSTYTLGYDSASDQLHGIYFQAAQGAQYQVAFSRRR